jgi:predicted nucleotidyltransferase component of viral defense system
MRKDNQDLYGGTNVMNSDSTKARLKNLAVKAGLTFQEALTYYGIERTIYRISISKYAEHFVLKGGIFLYAIFERNYERATTDIDFLAQKISNSSDDMKSIFCEILSQDTDDAIEFDLDSISVENITEFKQYHGLHVSALAYLERTKIPIGIDIGYGDVIYPNAVKMDFPVLLDSRPPIVNAYSLESAVAEKLEAIIRNGYLNSRYKDFYDIYILSEKYAFSYIELHNAVIETFKNRKTPITIESAAFSDDFINDSMHRSRWNAFLKKKKAILQISIDDVLAQIKIFAYPLLGNNDNNFSTWNPSKKCWE